MFIELLQKYSVDTKAITVITDGVHKHSNLLAVIISSIYPFKNDMTVYGFPGGDPNKSYKFTGFGWDEYKQSYGEFKDKFYEQYCDKSVDNVTWEEMETIVASELVNSDLNIIYNSKFFDSFFPLSIPYIDVCMIPKIDWDRFDSTVINEGTDWDKISDTMIHWIESKRIMDPPLSWSQLSKDMTLEEDYPAWEIQHRKLRNMIALY